MKQYAAQFSFKKVVLNDFSMPLVWKLILECGHVIYKPGSIVEENLPKRCRCTSCPKPSSKE
jgi:hypothetical protein